MTSGLDVYLKEYEQLRQELTSRINLAYALIALDLTVLGAGLTVFQAFPEIVVGLSAVSCFLWLIFMDHASQVYKIAAYISLHIAPNLRAVASHSMRWEEFLRKVDAGGRPASEELYGAPDQAVPREWIVSGGPSKYLAMLFGGSSPILVIAFVASTGVDGTWPERLLRAGVLLGSLGVWLMALIRYRSFQQTIRAINRAIIYRDTKGTGQSYGQSN